MPNFVRIAIVQDAPVAFDLAASRAKAIRLIEAAADLDAQLIVFPEAFLSGYPKGLDFGVRVGMRSDAGRAWFARYADSSIDLANDDLADIRSKIRERQVHVILGVIERNGGTLYCSAFTFDSAGTIVSRRRKLVPTAMERVIWGQGDATTLSVADTTIGQIGVAICWENYMPLLRTWLYSQGTQFYCAPTVDDRETWPATMRHIALEGRCFVISACQFASREDFPADFPEEFGIGSNSVLIRGGSCLVGPLGEFLISPTYDRAEILCANCDLEAIRRAQFDFDVVGHYARPDIFGLTVHGLDRQTRPSGG